MYLLKFISFLVYIERIRLNRLIIKAINLFPIIVKIKNFNAQFILNLKYYKHCSPFNNDLQFMIINVY